MTDKKSSIDSDTKGTDSKAYTADDLGIPILDEVIVPGSNFKPAPFRFQRSSVGRRKQDARQGLLSITEARLIAEKLAPEIEQALNELVTRKIQTSVNQIVEEASVELKQHILDHLKKLVRYE